MRNRDITWGFFLLIGGWWWWGGVGVLKRHVFRISFHNLPSKTTVVKVLPFLHIFFHLEARITYMYSFPKTPSLSDDIHVATNHLNSYAHIYHCPRSSNIGFPFPCIGWRSINRDLHSGIGWNHLYLWSQCDVYHSVRSRQVRSSTKLKKTGNLDLRVQHFSSCIKHFHHNENVEIKKKIAEENEYFLFPLPKAFKWSVNLVCFLNIY